MLLFDRVNHYLLSTHLYLSYILSFHVTARLGQTKKFR